MSDMKNLIKWGLCLILACLTFVSCKDDFDVNKLQDTSRLVIYCFPTESDTTFIAVTKSLPISSFQGNKEEQSRQTVEANIIYKVNGAPQEVKRIKNVQEARPFSKSHGNDWLKILVGQYYVVGKQKAGDKIEIQASADGCPSVSASTSIPEKVEIKMGDIRLNETSVDHDVYYSVDKLEATFSDPASSADYYWVSVTCKQKYGNLKGTPTENNRWQHDVYAGNYQEYLDYTDRDEYVWHFDSLGENIVWLELVTTSEPLINKKTQLNDDFGFDEYEYFNNAYIFNDRTINGQTYTMHLEVASNDSYWNPRYGWDYFFGFTYSVELYKVTPEYYRFLKSINDAQSNDWADAGLMQVTPTYSNVKGGFGVVAGYNVSISNKYLKPAHRGGDDIYTN